MRKIGLLTVCAFALALTACGGNGNSDDFVEAPSAPDLAAPMADAGPMKNVMAGTIVTLDGTASTDPDGSTLAYAWTLDSLPLASAATLSDADTARPSFLADLPGTYVASLVVTNDKGQVTRSSVTVTATAPALNAAPVADAGAGQNTVAGTTVTLDGSASTDANGAPLTYAWTLSSIPEGSRAVLDGADSARPSFVADAPGRYIASLIVHDGNASSAPQTITIEVAEGNAAPVADAGPEQNVVAGAMVSLDGSASTDANEDRLSFAWVLTSVPAGSTAVLTDADGPRPNFLADLPGIYVASLIVNDGTIDSAAATVAVTAAAGNSAPTADAGAAQNALVGQTVTLDGTGSTDANGDTLTYFWWVASRPTLSGVSMDSNVISTPSFTPDEPGVYVFKLQVFDGKLASAHAQVTVTVSAPNAAPIAKAGPEQVVGVGSTVTLDGSGSSDPNDDLLSYRWHLITVPASSSATLSGSDTAHPSFLADRPGSYVARLTVKDGSLESAEVPVTITAILQRVVGEYYTWGPGLEARVKSLSTGDLGNGMRRYDMTMEVWNYSMMRTWNVVTALYFRNAPPISDSRVLAIPDFTSKEFTLSFDAPASAVPTILQLHDNTHPTPMPGSLQWVFPVPGALMNPLP
jgi:hypothetical protein